MKPTTAAVFAAGAIVAVAGSVTSCASEAPPPSDQDLRDSLAIPPEVTIHRITLGGRGAAEHVVPTRIDVAPGDVVQFLNVDRRIHTVSFEVDSLGAEGRRFLTETAQLESPPLLTAGSRFVVTFRDAPSGVYPFRSEGPGGSGRGRIVVR